jgi:very-short-patch-repair endonuclease
LFDDGKTTKRIRGTTPGLDEAARSMRGNMTPAESRLWENLRSRRLGGAKFRAQHPLGRFIVDFCCPSSRLIIEIDGGVHRLSGARDRERTEVLESFGYRVLRFSNDQVLQHTDDVVLTIAEALLQR